MYNKDKQTLANEKWRDKNYERWLEINREEQKKYYDKHKENKKKKVYARYYFMKESERMRNILIHL
jgi:hypothetical protein